MARSDTVENPRAQIGDNNPPPDFDLRVYVDGTLDRLKLLYSDRMALIADAIATRANAAPKKVATDEELLAWGEIVNSAREAKAEFDTNRENEKRLFLKGGNDVQAFFKNAIERMDRIMEAGNKLGTDFQREKKRKADQAAADERKRLEEEAAVAKKKAEVAHEFGDTEKAMEQLQQAGEAQAQANAVQAPKTADAARVRSETSSTLATAGTEWKFEITNYEAIDLVSLRDFIAPAAIEKALRDYLKKKKQFAKLEGVRFYEDVKAQFRS